MFAIFIAEKIDKVLTYKFVMDDTSLSQILSARFDLLETMGKKVCLVNLGTQEVVKKNF